MAPSAIESPSRPGSLPNTKSNPFEQLVSSLSLALGPSSGLDSADVDLAQLAELMASSVSSESDWERYALADLSRGYTRNLVDEGNGKSNLLILVWTPGKGSPIHDHADAHCLMKVLKGRLLETRYCHPSLDTPLAVDKETVYSANQVTYMADSLGLHRISNPGNDIAVSLHLYTPPNAAREGCNVFDEKTGRSCHVSQSNFFSRFGKKV